MINSRYFVVVPVFGMDLQLLKFGKGYSWSKLWDDLQELDGRIVNQQIKLIVPLENVSRRPVKFFVCTLLESPTETDAYQQGLGRIEEFVYLANVFLRRSFRPLVHEVVIFSIPKKGSLADFSLEILNERIVKIVSPFGSWKPKAPYFYEIFGAVGHKGKDLYPGHFEVPLYQMDVHQDVNLISKKGWLDFEKTYSKLVSVKSNQKELLATAGQLYSAANSSETITLSYIMLWEVLELYSGIDKGRESLLTENILKEIRQLLNQNGIGKKDTQTVLDTLRGLKRETLTQQMARIIQTQFFPEKTISEVYQQVKEIRNTRNNLTHPSSSKTVDKSIILNDYQHLKEIVDKTILHLKKIHTET